MPPSNTTPLEWPSAPLRGQLALVTGGGARLGAAIVQALAAQGASLAIHHASSAAPANELAARLRAEGRVAECFAADFAAGADACGELLDSVAKRLGPPSLLINNAAVFEAESLASLREREWDRTLAINLKAPAFLAQAFARLLPSQREGCIVNVIDWRGTHPCPGHLSYTLAKAGLAALTRILAQELGPRIRVNAVAPGAILPPPGASLADFQLLGQRNPLRRVGSPADIVQAISYLVTAPFVTGEIIHVAGGEHLSRS